MPMKWRLLRAQCLIGIKDLVEAGTVVSLVLREDQRDSEALTLRAKIQYMQDSHPLANISQLLSNALAYDPDNKMARIFSKKIKSLEALKQQGNSAFKSLQWNDAEGFYSECLELDNDCGVYSVKALSNRAIVRSKVFSPLIS